MKKSVLTLLKQKEVFEELANKSEIQILRKQIHLNSLMYYFQRESDSENFISCKVQQFFTKI